MERTSAFIFNAATPSKLSPEDHGRGVQAARKEDATALTFQICHRKHASARRLKSKLQKRFEENSGCSSKNRTPLCAMLRLTELEVRGLAHDSQFAYIAEEWTNSLSVIRLSDMSFVGRYSS